jgi:hypothetical protein
LSLDEVVGSITIIDDDALDLDYREDSNQHECGQPTLGATCPPPLLKVTAADFQYPNGDGEISTPYNEPKDPFDADYTEDLPNNVGETLDQEHEVTYVLGMTGMTISMADQEQK